MSDVADDVTTIKEQLKAVMTELQATKSDVSVLRQRLGAKESDDGSGRMNESSTPAMVTNPLNDQDGLGAPLPVAMPTDSAGLQDFIKRTMAKAQETPLNLHQATVYYCCVKDCPVEQKLLFVSLSVGLTVLQVLTVGALFWNLMATGCRSNEDCLDDGFQFCHPLSNACDTCARAYTTNVSTLWYNGDSHCGQPIGKYYPFANLTGIDRPDFKCPFNDTICDACFDPATRSFHRHRRDHLGEMDKLAWITFTLTSVVTAASAAAELRDIKLCELVCARAKMDAWKAAVVLVQSLRQYAFLPVLLMMVPMVVEKKGGDPISICMNTVAILFLLEVDNQCCELSIAWHLSSAKLTSVAVADTHAMPDKVRSEVEEFGRATLDNASAKFVEQAKLMYCFILAVMMPFSVANAKSDGIMSVTFYMGLGGVIEQAAMRIGTPKERVVRGLAVMVRLPLIFITWLVPLDLFITGDPNARGGARGCDIFPDEHCIDDPEGCKYTAADELHIFHAEVELAPCNDGTNTLPENVNAVRNC
jgi:hypothetical protein